MNKWLKYFTQAAVVCTAFILGSTAAYAATTDAMIEKTLADSATERYGSAYDTPFVVPEGDVDSTSGAVSLSVQELSLPGKNGFDLELYRAHSSYDLGHSLEIDELNAYRTIPIYLAVPYTAEYNGEHYSIYVAYEREEDIEEEFPINAAALERYRTDEEGLKYKLRTDFSDGDETTLVWDKNADTEIVVDREMYQLKRKTMNPDEINIGDGWYIHIPYFTVVGDKWKSSSIRDYVQVYAEVGFEDGKKETLKYDYDIRYEEEGSVNVTYQFGNANMQNANSMYDIEMFPDESVTDPRGFTYNMTITDREGKTYYFNIDSIYETTNRGKICAVEDRYGNTILYKKSGSSWIITDTYGRKVTVSSSGITVDAGDMQKKITYQTETIRDTVNNASGSYYTFDTHKLTVSEYTGNGTSGTPRTTQYSMKYKSILKDDDYYFKNDYNFVPVITEIKYPTNVKRTYSYETEPEKPQFFITFEEETGFNSGDYFVYRVSGEKLYENNRLVSSKDYTYEKQWKPSQATRFTFDEYKTFKTTETLENGHKKENWKRYDQLGRILVDETSFKEGSKTAHSQKVEYNYANGIINNFNYPTQSEIGRLRRASIMNTRIYQDEELMRSEDCKFVTRSRLPLRQKMGETELNYTYDGTYLIPLTQTEKRLDAGAVKQTNTLTSDKKGIAKAEIYDGSVKKNTTEYTYNTDGTIASQKVYNGSETITTEYDYQYNSDLSYTVTVTVKSVTGADGTAKDISSSVTYDSLGRQVAVTDANGNTTSYEYDMLGQVTKQTNPDGTTQQAVYDIANNKITVTDERGYQTTKAYTPMGYLDSIYLDNDTNKTAAEYTYDNLGRKLSETTYMDFGGKAVTNEYTYDDLDRQLTVTSKEGGKVLDKATNTYTVKTGKIIEEKVSSSVEVDVSGYEKAEVMFKNDHISRPADNFVCDRNVYLDGKEIFEQEMEYLAADTQVFNISGGKTLRFTVTNGSYDITVRLLDTSSGDQKMIGGASQVVTTTYQGDATFVNPTTVTTVDGYGNTISQYYYDKTVSASNLLNKSVNRYDYQGNVIQNKSGRVALKNLADYSTKTEYNYLSLPTKEYVADGRYVTKEYDALGQLVKQTDPMGNSTTYEYDSLGRVIRTLAPFDETGTAETINTYDNNGNVIKTQVKNSKPGEAATYSTTEYEYDSRNRVITAIAHNGAQSVYTQYAYDAAGNMTKMVTGQTEKLSDLNGTLPDNASATTYEYDRFGNVTKSTDALGQSVTTEYNLVGLPTGSTDRNGVTTATTYNAYGSPVTVQTGSITQTNTYSANNLLLSTSNGTDTISYAYDDLGRLTKETNGDIVKTYTNDTDGNRTAFTLQSGGTPQMNAAYTYDTTNRLSTVEYPGIVSASFTYNDNDLLTRETRGAVTVDYTYNNGGLLTGMTNTVGGQAAETYGYTYSYDGKQLTKTDNTVGETTYAYDELGQLISESNSNLSRQYTYDSRGNRLTMTADGETTGYTYDKNNRMLSASTQDKTQTYHYDPNGNLYSRLTTTFSIPTGEEPSVSLSQTEEGDGAEFFTYNEIGQLTAYEGGGAKATYTYGADGCRKSKTVNGQTTTHIWDGDQMVMETGANSGKYYRAGSKILVMDTGSGVVNPLSNGHGDTTRLADSTGGKKAEYRYDAFGNQAEEQEEIYNPFRYAGEYYDSETGFTYLRARYYDPTTGRFISEDPHWTPQNMIYGDSTYKNKLGDSNVVDTKRSVVLSKNITSIFLSSNSSIEKILQYYDILTNKKDREKVKNEIEQIKYPSLNSILQSNNLYLYCINDPIVYIDPMGLQVYIQGMSGNAELSASLGGTAAMVFDDEGNMGYLITGSAGVGFFGASLTTTKGVLDLNNIYELKDLSFNVSVSVGAGIVSGGVAIAFKDNKPVGTIKNVGIGAGAPLSFNAQPFSDSTIKGDKVSSAMIGYLKFQFYAGTLLSLGVA